MRIIALSFLCFLIGVLYLIPAFTSWHHPAGFEFGAPVVLMLVAMVLQIDGLRQHRLIQAMTELRTQLEASQEQVATLQQSEERHKAVLEHKTLDLAQKEQEAERLAEQLNLREHRLNQNLGALNGENKKLQERLQTLQQALDEYSQQEARAAQSGPSQDSQGPSVAQALNLLALLQEKGRLIDFLQEDVSVHSDAQVGAAARIVHQGCSQVLGDFFSLGPVWDAHEGAAVTVDAGRDPQLYRVIGASSRQTAPFSGRLVHRGWQVEGVRLPELVGETPHSRVLMPAELEVTG